MKNYLLFALVGVFWGGSFVAIKYAIGDVPPTLAAWLRVLMGALFLIPIYLVTGKQLTVQASRRWNVWIAGLFAQGLPFAFLFWAEKSVSAGLAGIMNGTVPIWTFLLSLVYLKRLEMVSGRTLLGVALGFVGLIIINYPLIQVGDGSGQALGVLALLGMAICYSIGTIMNRRILAGDNKVDLYANVLQQHLASCVFLLVVTGVSGNLSLASVTSRSLLAVAYLGICSTAIAWLVFYTLIKEWGAVRASTITYVVPPVALLLDYLFFGNTPSSSAIIGALGILAGVFLIQSPPPPAAVTPVPNGSGR